MAEDRTKTVNKKRKYVISDREMFYIRGGLNWLANSNEETNQPRMAAETRKIEKSLSKRQKTYINRSGDYGRKHRR